MFATNARYKREAYRGSEYASKILGDNDIPVVLKVHSLCIHFVLKRFLLTSLVERS